VIYFRILRDRIEVLAILHGKREPTTWKRRV
jgi:plasmid stabilization system protein ParE